MADADRLTIEGCVPGLQLMERAGAAVANVVVTHYPGPHRVAVLAGPGNNGGDGYVVARLLQVAGYHARVHALGDPARLQGDAAAMAKRWAGPVVPFGAPDGAAKGEGGRLIVVDALFGAGLARALDAQVLAALREWRAAADHVIAVDVPSGVDGSTGALMPGAIAADHTVMFFRRKPAHLLYPARGLMGEVVCADIGIPTAVLDDIAPRAMVNTPALWAGARKPLLPTAHKYERGHVGVVSGPASATGAARLAARAALGAGAGLASLFTTRGATLVAANHETAVMVKPYAERTPEEKEDTPAPDLAATCAKAKLNVLIAGPALGLDARAERRLEGTLEAATPCSGLVLDADALTLMASAPVDWFKRVPAHIVTRTVLTPHEGEFRRLFPHLAEADKLARARQAAAQSGCTILLKGPDSVVAAPDGRASIAENAPPWLATAGAGDVLAGCVAAMLARNMPAFEAASAAVWLHGEAARHAGPYATADALPPALAPVLSKHRQHFGSA